LHKLIYCVDPTNYLAGDELDNEEIESICQNVLQRLKKEVPLEEDTKGFVSNIYKYLKGI